MEVTHAKYRRCITGLACLGCVVWCLCAGVLGCASYNEKQLESYQATARQAVESARDIGLEADANLRWGGRGEVTQGFALDLGAGAELRLRARPGQITEKDLLEIIKLLSRCDNDN